MRVLLVIILLLSMMCLIAVEPPSVDITDISQRTDGSKVLDVIYNLFDLENDLCDVKLLVSTNSGQSYDLEPSSHLLSGAIGENVAPGNGLHFTWDLDSEIFDLDGDNYWFRLIAEDNSNPGFPANFVYVPGGTFNWQGSNITISSFWIDKYEITQYLYQEVMKSNPGQGYGSGPQYPVYRVSWFNCIEYCNRRSLREGLQPVYMFATYGPYPGNWPPGWNSDYNSHNDITCDWSANGYRLLSYMEWLYAARGGLDTHNYIYSGSNVLDDVAWYVENSGGETHIVGTKQENELGIHDMTGNVWEWIWDRWDTSWNPGDCTDPHGPTMGSHHVTCGGSYSTVTQYCPLSWYNCGNHADTVYWNTGFRVCRNAD